ncbi:uncharacterized protein LOC144712391 [Wolffia australiana]
MASNGFRSMSSRAARSCINSFMKQRAANSETMQFSASRNQAFKSPGRASSSSRFPSELGGCSGLLLPILGAVTMARLNSSLRLTCRRYRDLSEDGTDGT